MKILIIEDEIKLANAIKRALELQKYLVDVAYNGSAGLDLAIGEKFDVIILDLMLPEINGIDICKQVRQQKITTPILMLTAKGQIVDKVAGLDSGADDYLVKPFSFDELFARIRSLTRRSPIINDTVLKAGDLILDSTAFKVKRGTKMINLSAKEFAILKYLLGHKNQTVTKQQIVDHVWNYSADILPSTIEVHIKHLRDKIDRSFKNKLINFI